jgi:hypothetical protein
MWVAQRVDPVIGSREELECRRPVPTREFEARSIEHHKWPGRQFEATDGFEPIEIPGGTQEVDFPIPPAAPPRDPDLLRRLAAKQLIGEAGPKPTFIYEPLSLGPVERPAGPPVVMRGPHRPTSGS